MPPERGRKKVLGPTARTLILCGFSLIIGLAMVAAAFLSLSAAKQVTTLDAIDSQVYQPKALHDASDLDAGIDGGRRAVTVTYAIGAIAFSIVGVTLLRGARRDQHLLTSEATVMRIAGEQAKF